MKMIALILLLATLASPVGAQEKKGVWRTPDGTTLTESPSRKSVGSLGGMILITPDQDWKEKWETSKETVPQFNQASEVEKDGSLFLITFFGGASEDEAGRSNLLCDFTLVRPDGTFAIEQHDIVCFPTDFAMERGITYMTNITIAFKADSSEPKGSWTYRMVLKDKIGGSDLPLETSFTVK
jgi:hypothetical protein